MTTRILPAAALPSHGFREHPLGAAIRSDWAALRAMLARAVSRRRLASSIAHLDDRLLADAGLMPRHRGLDDRLIGHFAAASQIWTNDKA